MVVKALCKGLSVQIESNAIRLFVFAPRRSAEVNQMGIFVSCERVPVVCQLTLNRRSGRLVRSNVQDKEWSLVVVTILQCNTVPSSLLNPKKVLAQVKP